MPVLFTNNASAPLAASISSSVTTITVTTAQGALFPALSGSDYFYATLTNSSNQLEIVKVTARASDSMTVVRGQEGTTALAYAAADKIEVRVTAAGLTNMVQLDGAQTISGAKNFSTTPTFSGGALSVSGGGTGVSTLTGVPYGNATSAFTVATGAQIVTAIGATAVSNATLATTATLATLATTATLATLATTATLATLATLATSASKLTTASGSAPSYSARAWVRFDGTGTIGTNQTITAAGNVTSVFKNALGDYTITFTTAMPDANYAVSATGSNPTIASGNRALMAKDGSFTTTTVTIFSVYTANISADCAAISVVIFC